MTTEATQGQQPAVPPEMDSSDVREVYRILGGLERGQAEIKERFDRQDQRFDRQDQRSDRHEERNEQQFDRHEERNEQRYRETNRRIDRLWYTIVGATIVILTGIAGLALQNALMS